MTDAGVKTDNTESEEADGCKMDYRPDRRVPGECGKFLPLATALLAVTWECDNSKIIYVHRNKGRTQNQKKKKNTSPFVSQILKESIGLSDKLF